MRGLTLWQPWASQVFDSVDRKDVENRSTLLPSADLLRVHPGGRREFFAVHAGLTYDDGPALARAGKSTAGRFAFPPGALVPAPHECPRGVIVGVARVRFALDDREWASLTIGVDDPPRGTLECEALRLSRWWLGPIGWKLIDAVPLSEPVPCRGALGCWPVPDDVAALVRQRAIRTCNLELEGRAYEGAPNAPARHVDRLPWMRVIDLVRAVTDLGG